MSFVARREVSQANNTRLLLELVTTTIFTYPTAKDPISQKSGVSVPVAAIVGGVTAGMLLAFIVTASWVYWGKSIKRTAAKEQSETVSLDLVTEFMLLTFTFTGTFQEELRKTRFNTLRNAAASKPRIQTHQPLFSRPAEKKIRFANDDSKNLGGAKVGDWRQDMPSLIGRREVPTFSVPSAVVPKLSKPKLLRSVKGSQRFASLAVALKDRPSISSLVPESGPSTEGAIPHKSSTISSASVYSTASAEEHQVWTLSDPILAALNLEGSGHRVDAAFRSSSRGTEWHSPTSSNDSYLSALDQGVPSSNRDSRASNGSAYSRVADGTPIGMAY